MTGRLILFVAVLCAAFPAAARADDRPLPWAGGQDSVSELEAKLEAVAAAYVRRPVSIYCQGTNDWGSLASQGGFDPLRVWGYVVFRWSGSRWEPLPYAHLSDQACWFLDQFVAAADKRSQKRCQTGTSPVYEDRTQTRVVWRTKTVTKRVRANVNGKWVTRPTKVRVRVRSTVDTVVRVRVGEEPIYTTCPDWAGKVFAYHTFAHETMHLHGVEAEHLAECWGMQHLARFMVELGADSEFAREIAADYWSLHYVNRDPDSEYVSPDCRDGGPLDLAAGSASWPAGF